MGLYIIYKCMIDYANFKIWLIEKNKYSNRTIGNIVSRLKRANTILNSDIGPLCSECLEEYDDFKNLSPSIKSQIKKSISLYDDFLDDLAKKANDTKNKIKAISLFSNIGVAEAYLEDIGVKVCVANELVEKRAVLYSKIYPSTKMICGDIRKTEIKNKLIQLANDYKVDVLFATPPCQGMSTVGKQDENDERNLLICEVVDIVKKIRPKYIFIENVPLFYKTKIGLHANKKLIPDYLEDELGNAYCIKKYIIDTKDYGVPQSRERAIILMSLKGCSIWTLPNKSSSVVTLKDAIGDLPMLDPYVKDINEFERNLMFPHYYERKEQALKISPWHKPPEHIYRQVEVMQHTPSGCTAFDNVIYFPRKEDGTPVKGYHNTYKRQRWDIPAYTVTMDNRKISSQNNVHPGKLEYLNNKGEYIYSDARALTLYEIMKIMTIPSNWPVPLDTPEAFLRSIIGEGIPPLFVKKVFENLKKVYKYEKN